MLAQPDYGIPGEAALYKAGIFLPHTLGLPHSLPEHLAVYRPFSLKETSVNDGIDGITVKRSTKTRTPEEKDPKLEEEKAQEDELNRQLVEIQAKMTELSSRLQGGETQQSETS